MIEIQNLSKSFGSLRAVDGISFRVGPGEVLGFLGPNGAGKSTTMKMVTGFLTPSGGTVRVCGHDVARDPLATKRSIGYLPEGAPLYGDMTPASLLAFAAEVRRIPRARRAQRIAEVAEMVHIGPVLRQRIGTLSKGFKRRVGLAQAILHDPEVLVLDEPTDGLDPNQKHEVRELIAEMAPRKTIVLSTHILEEVEAVCTRAIIIAKGRILFDGRPAELQARSPRHNSIALAIRGANRDSVTEALKGLAGVARVEGLGGEDGLERYRLYPDNGALVLPGLNTLAQRAGWEVDDLAVEKGKLDEVFRMLTETGATALS